MVLLLLEVFIIGTMALGIFATISFSKRMVIHSQEKPIAISIVDSVMKNLKAQEASIDFTKANEEQARLFRELSQKGESEVIRRFVASSRRTKNAQISQYLLVRQIMDTAKRSGIETSAYPTFSRYQAYLKEFSEVKLSDLLGAHVEGDPMGLHPDFGGADHEVAGHV